MLLILQINWLNAYNKRIRTVVGPELMDQGLPEVYYWMSNKTIPYELPSKAKKPNNSAETLRCAREWIVIIAGMMLAYLM